MHSMPASAACRCRLAGGTTAKSLSVSPAGTKEPLASRHLSKKRVMSTARSLITVRWRSGSIRKVPAGATCTTRVRQVHCGRPLTTMAQEPHMPTRQAKPIGQRCVLLALDFGDHVEDGLVRAPRHAKALEASVRAAAPDLDKERR